MTPVPLFDFGLTHQRAYRRNGQRLVTAFFRCGCHYRFCQYDYDKTYALFGRPSDCPTHVFRRRG